jgi:hypothetical protein
MSIDDVTTQLRSQLQEAFGVDGASYLMDRPPGGWSDLVTNDSLDRRIQVLDHGVRSEIQVLRTETIAEFAIVRSELSAMRHELRAEIDRQITGQTWRLLTAMLSMMAVLIAVMAALIKL